jgi:hypothetical protein
MGFHFHDILEKAKLEGQKTGLLPEAGREGDYKES